MMDLHKGKQLVWILCGIMVVTILLAKSMSIEVIHVYNRPAEELMSALKPLLPEGASVQANGYNLIIKTTPTNLREISQVIRKLDQLPQQLVVSVRRMNNAAYNSDSNTWGNVKVVATTGSRHEDEAQRVSVQSGNSAFIRVGEEIPIHNRSYGLYGGSSYTYYQPVYRGFYVTPRLTPEGVIVNIRWGRSKLENNTVGYRQLSPIASEAAATEIRVPLGEWVNIGQVSTQSLRTRDVKVYNTQDLRKPETNWYIKVDKPH